MDIEPHRDEHTPDAQPPAEPDAPPTPHGPSTTVATAGAPRPPLRLLDVAVLGLIVVAYALALFIRLGHPGTVLETSDEDCRKWPPLRGAACHEMIPLDEVHYVPDARDVVRFGTESDTRVPTPDDGAYVVHPPVGKWFIALGMQIFGDRPFGWRAFGCVFAIAGVLIAYALARRLWGSPWLAALAALLLAADGLWFVQARVAMLDIYAATFTLAGIWLLLEARARARWRWWVAAGVALGLAVATKWGPAPIVAVAIIAAVRWGGWRALASAALIPVVYVATFTPWFVDDHRYVPPACEGAHIAGVFGAWYCYQNEMYHFHRDLEKYEPADADEEEDGTSTAAGTTTTTDDATTTEASGDTTIVGGDASDGPGATGGATAATALQPAHPYFGHAWSWPWIGRPVAHHYEGEGGRAEEVLGLPNPVTWWAAFFLAIPALVFLAFRKDAIARLLLALVGAAYLPYVAADLLDRPVFLFYATPLVPLLTLAIVHVIARAVARWAQAATAAVGFAIVAVASAAFFYPVLAAYPVPGEGGAGSWRARIWFTQDCGVEDRIKIWCWI